MPSSAKGFLPVKAQIATGEPHRYVYLKEHRSTLTPEGNESCFIFVTGLPACLDPQAALEKAFAQYGSIISVLLHVSQVSRAGLTSTAYERGFLLRFEQPKLGLQAEVEERKCC